MYDLLRFESSKQNIPEVDSIPGLDGILAVLLALILFLGLMYWVKNLVGASGQKLVVRWIAFIILGIVLGSFLIMHLNVLLFFVLIVVAVRAILLVPVILRSKLPPRKKVGLSLLVVAVVPALIKSYAAYYVSYVFWLPASYAPEIRDQLRMMRRIIEVQCPNSRAKEHPLVPLDSAHLVVKDTELIPESIRKNSEYEGYRYVLNLNRPKPGQFTLDATPLNYQPGMPSFHAYHEYEATDYDFVIYCVTMADHSGAPATVNDPHFHRRTLLPWGGSWAVPLRK